MEASVGNIVETGVKKFAYEALNFDDGQFFANANVISDIEEPAEEVQESVSEVAEEVQVEAVVNDPAQDYEKPTDEIPAPATYSDSELELAKKLAKEEGLKEGQELANKHHEEELAKKEVVVADLIEKIDAEVARLQGDVEAKFVGLEKDIKEIGMSVVNKILGDAADAKYEGEIESFIAKALEKAKPYGPIKIYLSDGASKRIKGKFKDIEIAEDSALAANDFRIIWDNGYAERNVAQITEQVKELVAPVEEAVETVAEEAVMEAGEVLNDADAPPQEEVIVKEEENNENNKIEEDKNE